MKKAIKIAIGVTAAFGAAAAGAIYANCMRFRSDRGHGN